MFNLFNNKNYGGFGGFTCCQRSGRFDVTASPTNAAHLAAPAAGPGRLSLLNLPAPALDRIRSARATAGGGRADSLITRRQFGGYAAALGATAMSGCAAAQVPAAGAFDLGDLERRTFDWFWDTANPAQRPGARPLADQELQLDRRGRLRADRLPDRRRTRLDQPGAGARTDACHAALLRQCADGPRSGRAHRLQGLLLPFHRHGERAAVRDHRAVLDRHHVAARRRAVRGPIFRSPGRRRGGDPPPRRAAQRGGRLALDVRRRRAVHLDGMEAGERLHLQPMGPLQRGDPALFARAGQPDLPIDPKIWDSLHAQFRP